MKTQNENKKSARKVETPTYREPEDLGPWSQLEESEKQRSKEYNTNR